MSDDLRCCGSGTCLINAAGVCWCGQKWDGDSLCLPPLQNQAPRLQTNAVPAAPSSTGRPPRSDATA